MGAARTHTMYKRPQRALAVRGGEVDPITIGKGIVAASGIYGAFDPAANAGLYGIKAEDKGNAMMRLMGCSQILFAAALNLDMDSVHRTTKRADGRTDALRWDVPRGTR